MKVTAVSGSYRKGGVVESVVDEMLAAAREAGAEAVKLRLQDKEVLFCTNCRACTQQEGSRRGKCPLVDDTEEILDLLESSDCIVLASPVNFGTVTAITKRFLERLVCYAYWPWGARAPELRRKEKSKRVVIVASSAAPGCIARWSYSPLVKLLKAGGEVLGARTVGVLFVGGAASEQHQEIPEAARKKARRLGRKLALAPRQ